MLNNLKSFRESLSLTQKEFASILDIATTTYSGYEQGTRNPNSDFWVIVARKFSVSIDFLMGVSQDPHPTDQIQAYSIQEQDHINQYRELDEHGKTIVDLVMAKESKRVSQLSLHKIE